MWGMSYIPLEEIGPVKPPCESLGHFYEDFACIYCPATYCATEMGGHSFEKEFHSYASSPPTRFCYHCKRRLVNLRKGYR